MPDPELVTTVTPEGHEIRKFADETIQAQIDAAVARANVTSTGVVFELAFDQDHINLAVVGKRGEHWTYVGVVGAARGEGPYVGGNIRYQW